MRNESLVDGISFSTFLAASIMAAVGIYQATKKRKPNEDGDAYCYTNINHPEKCLMDKLLSSIFPLIFPLSKMSKQPSYDDDNEIVKTITQKFSKQGQKGFETKLEEYSKFVRNTISSDYLVSGDVYVPRDPDILGKFGIPNAEEILRMSTKPQDSGAEIVIQLICPASAIKDVSVIEEPKDVKGKGPKKLKACKLEDIRFSENAHVVLWFHGGGFVLGSAKDEFAIGRVLDLMKCQGRQNKDKSFAPPIILLSVEYRLAPQNPFPSAIIDGLSASSFLAERFSTNPIHVAGISAGGNLSAIVGLESHRKYPGKFKSIVADIPMFEPTSATESHRLNSQSSGICPVDFLRWCWSAYFQLEQVNDKKVTIDFSSEVSFIDAFDSSIWSKFMNSQASRLVSPTADLPDLSNDDDSPTILVMTATADPLHDAGVDFFKCVEVKSKKCVHIESKGSHVLNNTFDKSAVKKLIEEWSLVFSATATTRDS
jgi:acetyl esterase/lipase